MAHCPKMNMNEKTKQVPIQLPSIARTLSDAKVTEPLYCTVIS